MGNLVAIFWDERGFYYTGEYKDVEDFKEDLRRDMKVSSKIVWAYLITEDGGDIEWAYNRGEVV